jgi:hypothetical protein
MPVLWLKAFFNRHRGFERVGGRPCVLSVDGPKTGSEVAPSTLAFLATKRHKKHKMFSSSVKCFLCFFVAIVLSATA